jgi:hypothetical protein
LEAADEVDHDGNGRGLRGSGGRKGEWGRGGGKVEAGGGGRQLVSLRAGVWKGSRGWGNLLG